MKNLLITTALLFLISASYAQETGFLDGLHINGYVDGYFQEKTTSNDKEVSNRAFYDQAGTFALGNANVIIEKHVGDFGFTTQLGFGPRAEVANGAFGSSGTPIQQLFIDYKLSEKTTLTFGNFGTFVGYEVIDAPANFNYSTSLLFQNGPFYHTGLKSDFVIGDKGYGAMVGVFNTTDSKVDIGPSNINYGAQFSKSGDKFNGYLNGIYGEVNDFDGHNRGQIDLVVDYAASEKTYLALNPSYQFNEFDSSDTQSWFGVAGYIQQDLTEASGIGFRGEFFSDKDGYAGVAGGAIESSVTNYTLSGNIAKDGFKFIPEIRLDVADSEYYFGEGENLAKTQFTVGAAVMYSF